MWLMRGMRFGEGMTENKRFENRLNRDIKKFHALNPVWDNKLETAWNVFEMIEIMNDLNDTVERVIVFKNLIGKKYSLSEPHRAYLLNNNKPLFHWINDDDKIIDLLNNYDKEYKSCLNDVLRLEKENEQLKQDIENLKITIDARETLIDVCEKKFRELGYIITVDDDGYVIE